MIKRFCLFFLIIILGFTFFSRVYRLHLPEDYYFDEVYHAYSAQIIAQNDPRAFEWWHPVSENRFAIDWLHPPIAKYSQALMIKIFSDNSFGWRISSAIFGVFTVLVASFIGFILTSKPYKFEASLLAAFFMSVDGLLLVQSRITMNDIHATFFILLSFTIYIKLKNATIKQKWWAILLALVLGLSVATKWSAIFIIFAIAADQAIIILKHYFKNKKFSLLINQTLFGLLFLFIIPLIIYIASYAPMFIQGKNLAHFKQLHQQIWWYQTNLEATHPYQSRPHQWLLNTRPVWYALDQDSPTPANIYAVQNPGLWIVQILSLIYLVVKTLTLVVKKLEKKIVSTEKSQLYRYSLLLFVFSALWVPWVFSPRIMFYYHFAPASAFLNIIAGLTICEIATTEITQYKSKSTKKILKILKFATIFIPAIGFLAWFAHWTYLPTTPFMLENVYFYFNFWR